MDPYMQQGVRAQFSNPSPEIIKDDNIGYGHISSAEYPANFQSSFGLFQATPALAMTDAGSHNTLSLIPRLAESHLHHSVAETAYALKDSSSDRAAFGYSAEPYLPKDESISHRHREHTLPLCVEIPFVPQFRNPGTQLDNDPFSGPTSSCETVPVTISENYSIPDEWFSADYLSWTGIDSLASLQPLIQSSSSLPYGVPLGERGQPPPCAPILPASALNPDFSIDGSFAAALAEAGQSPWTSPRQPNDTPGYALRDNPFDCYAPIPLRTFPTPSELLSKHGSQSEAQGVPEVAQPEQPAERKFEPQRKMHHRAVAHSLGFKPTDPDSISSHDKKRYYLECLEQYVVYLHNQMRIIGVEPVSLERLSTSRGLNSRSIRTLLVHMEDKVRNLHQACLREEQAFLNLREQVIKQQEILAASRQAAESLSTSAQSAPDT